MDDLDEFVGLTEKTFSSDFESYEQRQRAAHELYADPSRNYLASIEGRTAGSIAAFEQQKKSRVFINALGALPEQQGRGYGWQILSMTTDRLANAGWPHIMIEVYSNNEPALNLYRSSGFADVATFDYYRVDAA